MWPLGARQAALARHRRAQYRGGTTEAWAQLSQQRRRRRGQGQRRNGRGAGSSVRVCGHGSRRQPVAGAAAALAEAAAARGRPLAPGVRHDPLCDRMLAGGTSTNAAGFCVLPLAYACLMLHVSLHTHCSLNVCASSLYRADKDGRARSRASMSVRSGSAAARAPQATTGPRASWMWTAAACRAASLTTSGHRTPPGRHFTAVHVSVMVISVCSL